MKDHIFHQHRPVPELDLPSVLDPFMTVWRWCKCGAVNNGWWGWQHAETREQILEYNRRDSQHLRNIYLRHCKETTMAEPVQRKPEVDKALDGVFGKVFGIKNLSTIRDEAIRNNTCVPPPIGCSGPATEFRNETCRREFTILGMCQNCQDKIEAAYEEQATE